MTLWHKNTACSGASLEFFRADSRPADLTQAETKCSAAVSTQTYRDTQTLGRLGFGLEWWQGAWLGFCLQAELSNLLYRASNVGKLPLQLSP